MKLLEVNHLNKNYGNTCVLNDISISIEAGEFVAVMGQSGCGKSTLLYCASGMDAPSSGTIRFGGCEFGTLTAQEMQRLRLEKMGFIFQKTSFLKNLSIADNIVFPAFQLGTRKRNAIVREMTELMEEMDIGAIAESDITEVSGGQLQRAAICRAMINHPNVLFGDEPTGALNSSATQDVLDIMLQINQKGTALFLVTHDAKVAERADRVIYLEDGQIKSILPLGKYSPADVSLREQRMKNWLKEMNF